MEKRKLTIKDFNGTKLDTSVIMNKKDLKDTLKKWELKGLL